jgi:hypothetical protein
MSLGVQHLQPRPTQRGGVVGERRRPGALQPDRVGVTAAFGIVEEVEFQLARAPVQLNRQGRVGVVQGRGDGGRGGPERRHSTGAIASL